MVRARPILALIAAAIALVAGGKEALAGADDFNPIFTLDFPDINTGAHATFQRQVQVLSGPHVVAEETISVPAGFDIAADAQVTDGDQVGFGTLSADQNCDGSLQNYSFRLLDEPIEPGAGEKARWKLADLTFAQLTMVVKGSVGAGHTIYTLLLHGLSPPSFCPPMNYTVVHQGISTGGTAIWTNPVSEATYTWSGRFISSPLTSPPEHDVTLSQGVLIAPDADGDHVSDSVDNCLGLYNPDQANTDMDLQASGASVTGDSLGDACDPDDDNDSYGDTREQQIGTDTLDNCANSTVENAFPADINNDTLTDGTDLVAIANWFGLLVPTAPVRYDIAPDPPDGFVDGTDLTNIANFFGKQCH